MTTAMKLHRILLALLLTALLQSCSQAVINPDATNPHHVTVKTMTNSEKPVPDVGVSFFLDPQHTSPIGPPLRTDPNGLASVTVSIPVLGHAYSILVQGAPGPNGTPGLTRDIDLFLHCQDTLIPIYLDGPPGGNGGGGASGGDTTSITDCTNSWGPVSVNLHACPNDSAAKSIAISNNCPGPVTYTISPASIAAPFTLAIATNGTLAGNSATLQPGGLLVLTVKYFGAGQSQDKSTSISIAGSSGTIPVTIVGSPRTDCTTPPTTADCAALNLPAKTIDFGDVCNTKPSGPFCTSITNTGAEAMQIGLPSIPAPFSMAVRDNSGGLTSANPITLSPGQNVSLCFSIANFNPGNLSQKLNVSVTCVSSGKSTTFPITLNASVKKCDTCDCPSAAITSFDLSESISVINGDTTVNIPVFTNTTTCEVTVSPAGQLAGDDWQLSPPSTFSDVVPPNGVLKKSFRFIPRDRAGSHTFTLPLTLLVGPQQKPCTGQTTVKGTACRDICYIISSNPSHLYPRKNPDLYDTIWSQESGNIKVQVSYPGNTNTAVPECITLSNPDTACNPITVTVSNPNSPFGVSPSGSVSISPGSKQDICVSFTAPTVEEIRARHSLIYSDHLTISQSAPCKNDYTLYAVVDTFQHCRVEQKLTVYAETTPAQRAALEEVYDFRDDKVYNQVPEASPGVPNAHDLYLLDPTTLQLLPKPGVSRGLTTLPPGDPLFTDFCNNAEKIATKYKPQLPGMSYNSTTTIGIGDVVAAQLDNNTYALLYVTAAGINSLGLHYVLFVVIFPL